jgi:hypothetical protein
MLGVAYRRVVIKADLIRLDLLGRTRSGCYHSRSVLRPSREFIEPTLDSASRLIKLLPSL